MGSEGKAKERKGEGHEGSGKSRTLIYCLKVHLHETINPWFFSLKVSSGPLIPSVNFLKL